MTVYWLVLLTFNRVDAYFDFCRNSPLSPYQIVVPTPNIVSCNESRPFWVSWKDAVISVGRGNKVGDRTFMTFQSRYEKAVHAISISGWNSEGFWEFHEIENNQEGNLILKI